MKQAGSLVAPDRLRFDYTHYAAPSEEEIQAIEHRINQIILDNRPVVIEEMGLNEATDAGAIAFFGEKYQQKVRVVSIPDVSMELCGGTHTRATGDIGLFKIVSEGGIAAGVRRVEALRVENRLLGDQVADLKKLVAEVDFKLDAYRK